MASFLTFICDSCGYSIATEPEGHYALMSGLYQNFLCTHCKEIVKLRVWDIVPGKIISCPKCHTAGTLTEWNPVEGKCPKCGGKMIVDENSGVVMVD